MKGAKGGEGSKGGVKGVKGVNKPPACETNSGHLGDTLGKSRNYSREICLVYLTAAQGIGHSLRPSQAGLGSQASLRPRAGLGPALAGLGQRSSPVGPTEVVGALKPSITYPHPPFAPPFLLQKRAKGGKAYCILCFRVPTTSVGARGAGQRE